MSAQPLAELAPEMAALLRSLEWAGGDSCGMTCCPCCSAELYVGDHNLDNPPPHDPGCELAALLERLRKAGA